MTLILSCVTDEYVIQASDRRLTDEKGRIFEDKENKVVDWSGQILFGYTGLARVIKKPMDCWLAEALLNDAKSQYVTITEILDKVTRKATATFKFLKVDRKWKRMTIAGVGWVQYFEDNRIKPIICFISNCIDDNGMDMPAPKAEFTHTAFELDIGGNGFYLMPTGQFIGKECSLALKRNIEKCLKNDVGPEPVGRLLVEAIRDVAKSNSTVGKNVLVSCIPKESLHKNRIKTPEGSVGFYVSLSKPQRQDRTFLYFPEDKEEGVQYGPNFVLGGSWLRDFCAYQEGAKTSCQVRTMRLEPGATQGLIIFEGGPMGQFISLPKSVGK